MDCLFCKIANKNINAKIAFENERVIAFHAFAFNQADGVHAGLGTEQIDQTGSIKIDVGRASTVSIASLHGSSYG